MLDEFKDIIEPSKLPKKRKELFYYLAGFADAEGCFNVSLKHQESSRFSWVLDPVFHITQHKNNIQILELYKRLLMCGRIIEKYGQPNTFQFYVDNRKQLVEKIIPFFERFKLITKVEDFQKFKRIVIGLEKKEHSNIEMFKRLVKVAFEMNLEGKQRRYKLEDILIDLDQYSGSSEAIRQTSTEKP